PVFSLHRPALPSFPTRRSSDLFWAFPFDQWAENLKAYLVFADDHYRRYGFRCNMPLGSYFIKRDTSSLLSYTYDGDVLSLDPIQDRKSTRLNSSHVSSSYAVFC